MTGALRWRPTVTVIMNCRNAERFLVEALESARNQTYRNYEIVLWDNCSTDGTEEIGREYERDGVVRYFRGEEPLVLGAARNRAVSRARGRYLAFLDSDDVWLPEFLAETVRRLDADDGCAVVYTDAYRVTAAGVVVGRFSESTRFRKGRCFEELLRENFISAFSSVVMRADVTALVGGFRPEYEICEEYELMLRMLARAAVDFVPEPLVKYRWHGDNTSAQQLLRVREGFAILDEWEGGRVTVSNSVRRALFARRLYLQAALCVALASEKHWYEAIRAGTVAAGRGLLAPFSMSRVMYGSLVRRGLQRLVRRRHGGERVVTRGNRTP